MYRKKILVVDDSIFFTKLISNALTPEGYNVIQANTGTDGLRLVREEKPDLLLLDIIMPDISGFEVCRILRASAGNNLMPIIMLTSRNDHEDMLIGLDLGADDYIIKPFDNRELVCRVKNMLRRIDRNRDANPLTGLPGNLEIQRELDYRITCNVAFAAIYADLDNFKAYNDAYGFSRGDTAIMLTADILSDETKKRDNGAFIGHIGGDDFIIVTGPQHADDICLGIVDRFDQKIRRLYSPEDLDKGHIITTDRQGCVAFFPIMTISLAIVTNESAQFVTYLEVSDIAAELKKKAKSMPGSCVMKDMRKN